VKRISQGILSMLLMTGLCLSAAGCGAQLVGDDKGSNPADSSKAGDNLFDRLPKEIRDRKEITIVNYGSQPPWYIPASGSAPLTGAAVDMEDALSKLLGVKIKRETVSGLPAVLTGLSAGRFDMALGPAGDTKERQAANDLVDWVQEEVVFTVQKGNPAGIKSLADTCGKRVALLAGGAATKVATKKSEACVANGQKALELQTYQDLPTMILAVQSNRADAGYSSAALMNYFVIQSGGALELQGLGEDNGFPLLYQGAVLPKGSQLTPVILAAFEKLIQDGTYDQIMTKWKLDTNKTKPGLNLAKG